MTEIRFYHLTRSTVDQALPDLLERTLSRGWRAVVKGRDEAEVESLNERLWTFRSESFLPHSTAKEGCAEDQPVWLTTAEENPNKAQVLFLLDGVETEMLDDYELVCSLFDGNDSDRVAAARGRWTAYKQAGHQLAYWQQGEKGWTNKGQ